jgi:hypothetical protein
MLSASLSKINLILYTCVNTNKAKILRFRNLGKIKSDEKLNYGDCNLEIVDSFCYLGLMYYNGNFKSTQKQLPIQGLKGRA